MSLVDNYEYCWYEYTNQYPFYISVQDENGDAKSDYYVLRPREFFLNLGLRDPRNYYNDPIYD